MLQTISISCIFTLVLALSIWEVFFPAHRWPKVKSWWLRVFILQGLVYLIVTFGVSGWQDSIARIHIIRGEDYLSPFWGGVVTYLVGTFIFYWWHRWRHQYDFLWRTFHQMHHSPSRIQAVTAFYVHPLEAVASSLINAFLVLGLFGLGKESLVWNASFMALAGIFYHMNLHTPPWLGYFIQRPEMHRYHHEIGVHGRNYGDVPWWDMIFGTHFNPPRFEGDCGFGDGKELQFTFILLGKDVNAPPKIEENSVSARQ